jgi:hypothetical protein
MTSEIERLAALELEEENELLKKALANLMLRSLVGEMQDSESLRSERQLSSDQVLVQYQAKHTAIMQEADRRYDELVQDIERGFMQGAYARLKNLQNAERELAQAQTEIKGHMRVVDELRADLDRAYQILELHGVPRERAKSVANGIDVLASRFDKQNHFYEQALARENEAQSRIAELEKDAARFQWWAKWWTDPNDELETINSVGGADTPDEFRAAIDEALKARA